MKKYAKIINEETKQLYVGFEDPNKVFEEKVIPEVTHEEKIVVEQDVCGEVIENEETITVVDEEEHKVIITYGDYYKSCGMEEMEIEQSYTGQWYLEGYAPEEPAPTEEEQKGKRAIAYQQEVDPITCHIQRLEDEEQTPEVEQKIAELKQERSDKVEEIKERYPYPVGDE